MEGGGGCVTSLLEKFVGFCFDVVGDGSVVCGDEMVSSIKLEYGYLFNLLYPYNAKKCTIASRPNFPLFVLLLLLLGFGKALLIPRSLRDDEPIDVSLLSRLVTAFRLENRVLA